MNIKSRLQDHPDVRTYVDQLLAQATSEWRLRQNILHPFSHQARVMVSTRIRRSSCNSFPAIRSPCGGCKCYKGQTSRTPLQLASPSLRPVIRTRGHARVSKVRNYSRIQWRPQTQAPLPTLLYVEVAAICACSKGQVLH